MTDHRLCVIHPFDPRRVREGSIESRISLILAGKPADFSVLLVGVDQQGDLPLGVVTRIDVAGRAIDFLPVGRSSGAFSFGYGLTRHIAAIRRAAEGEFVSTELHGYTWASFARAILGPAVLVVHGDPGHRGDEEPGGLAGLTMGVREAAALRLANRVVGTDEAFVRRCRLRHPSLAAKVESLPIAGDDAAQAGLLSDETQITRLYERHRRLFCAHTIQRGQQAAA